MINLIIDTNIYRKNPRLDNGEFKALENLANAKIIRIHLPYIIQREFQTQQREICKNELDKIISSISSLLRRPLNNDVLENINKIKHSIDECYSDILDASESYFTDWIKKSMVLLFPYVKNKL